MSEPAPSQRRRYNWGMRHALTFWRRSIQARVVASTLALSLLVVSAVGWLLVQQIREGLLDNRVSVVVAEAANETADAQSALAAASGTEINATRQQRELAAAVIRRGESQGFSVVLGGPVGQPRIADGGAEYTTDLDLESVPLSLQEYFGEPTETAWTYTSIVRTDPEDEDERVSEPGVVVGSQVVLPADGQTYTLYFLYPLRTEAETLALVTRTLLTAAVLLVALIAGVAWLVTRQVVTPITLARRVAERLAAGELTERLRVSGEDDLSRLAVSFNQMATSLQLQIGQLEELSRVQQRFVSDVSHELRTPLTTVRMASEVLHDARDTFDAPSARAAELLQNELDRFEMLLTDLLEISRFDAGAAVLSLEELDLRDVALVVVAGTAALSSRRSVSVQVIDDGQPCLVDADERRVERVLRNLISNAIDHAEEGSVVICRLASTSHAAAVAVRDYGVGFQASEATSVFERFWRADPARTRTSGGTGLGLSIAREDALLHGGWLQAWGRPGQGAQFRLTLPRHRGQQLAHSPIPLIPADAAAAGATTGRP